jgi:hypothetical protein
MHKTDKNGRWKCFSARFACASLGACLRDERHMNLMNLKTEDHCSLQSIIYAVYAKKKTPTPL